MHQSFKLFKASILAALLLLMLTATALAAPAEITSSVHPQYPDINIPVVTIPDNPEATDAINAAIKQNIDTFIAQTAEIRDNSEEWNRVYLAITILLPAMTALSSVSFSGNTSTSNAPPIRCTMYMG